LAQAIEAKAGDNEGVNVRRRMQEAANVRGGSGAPANQVEAVDQVMNDPVLKERPEAQAAAVARINKSYALQQKERTLQKAAFDTKVKDSTAEALVTGSTSNPIPREDFMRQFGEIDGPNKYNDYISDVKFGADYKAMQTMSDVEMNQLIDQRTPAPGQEGFAHETKNVDRLRKGATTLQKERREDPAGAVSRMAAVQEVYSQLDKNDPQSFQKLAAARLAAQETLGIDPEYRSPITRAEALQMTAPMRTMLPGQERETLKQMGEKFQMVLARMPRWAFLMPCACRSTTPRPARLSAASPRSWRSMSH
jgi:hypothetical protein